MKGTLAVAALLAVFIVGLLASSVSVSTRSRFFFSFQFTPAIKGYVVYRRRSSTQKFGTYKRLVPPVTQYVDTGVTSGATYAYRVAAFNTVGTGPRSNARTVTVR